MLIIDPTDTQQAVNKRSLEAQVAKRPSGGGGVSSSDLVEKLDKVSTDNLVIKNKIEFFKDTAEANLLMKGYHIDMEGGIIPRPQQRRPAALVDGDQLLQQDRSRRRQQLSSQVRR